MDHRAMDEDARPDDFRRRALVAVAVLVAALVGFGLAPAPATAGSRSSADAAVVTDWNAIAVRTVFAEAKLPAPVGQLYLGIVAAAVYDAVVAVEGGYEPYLYDAGRDAKASAGAAAATAAHGVLSHYFPDSAGQLAADLAATVAGLEARAKAVSRGEAIGAAVAAAFIADRADDGRGADVTLDVEPGPGVWEPTPPNHAPMVAPWLGFVRPLLLDAPDQFSVNGPDPLTSDAYAADFAEVEAMGSAEGSDRTPEQTETALFWSDNPPRQYQEALQDHVERHQLGIMGAARLFAVVSTSAADGLVACWRVKYDQPTWRPSTAIQRADEDGNEATTADPAWTPLLADPPYPEYPSGHACLTGAVTGALSHLYGPDGIDLVVESTVTGTTRHFATADELDQDAANGRVWLGIHFRRAMLDGNQLGHQVADWALERWFQPQGGCS